MKYGLSRKTHYIQVAMNSTPGEAAAILSGLPVSERILVEAGTPLIKAYGADGIRAVRAAWQRRLFMVGKAGVEPYIVADMKAMDRGESEVGIAAAGGASAAVVLGLAPTETLNAFVATCEERGLDAMVDMMNVEKPYQVLRKMKKLPKVVILHRGVDEERDGGKMLPIHMINKVKGAFDVLVAVAGGDTPREVQSAVFNGADIVVLWKDFYRAGGGAVVVEEFLRQVK
jgi:bifunctional enzyme Fae/Hps